jgi:hypothetical protein
VTMASSTCRLRTSLGAATRGKSKYARASSARRGQDGVRCPLDLFATGNITGSRQPGLPAANSSRRLPGKRSSDRRHLGADGPGTKPGVPIKRPVDRTVASTQTPQSLAASRSPPPFSVPGSLSACFGSSTLRGSTRRSLPGSGRSSACCSSPGRSCSTRLPGVQ